MMESFEIQALRNVVKESSPNAVDNFEKKFKEIKIEGKRKSHNSYSTMYTETLPKTYYTEAEQKEIEAMYMGTESEARKRYQGNRSISQQQSQSQYRKQRSFSRPRYDPRQRYDGYDNRSRFDRFKSPGRRGEIHWHDRS